MSLEVTQVERVFNYAGVRLIDVDPTMTAMQVRDLYAASGRPELSSAEIHGPELIGNEQHFSFHRAVGTKAAAPTCDADLATIETPQLVVDALAGFGIVHHQISSTSSEIVSIAMVNAGSNPTLAPSQLIPWLF